MKLPISKIIQNNGIIFVLMIVLVTYINILFNNLVWDDHAFLSNWSEIWNWQSNLMKLITGNVPIGHEGVYRPIRSLIYALVISIAGKYIVLYHLFSILVLMATTLLVFLFVLKLTNHHRLALVTALLFGVHPIHTEAISWITASFDSAGVVFLLGSLISYVNFLKSKKQIKSRWYWGSVVLATLAIFTNEVSLVVPVFLILIEKWLGLIEKNNWKERIKIQLPFWGIFLGYWIVRWGWLNIGQEHKFLFDSFWSTVSIMPVMVVRYLQLLVWPWNLSVNHNLIPGVSSFYYHDYNFASPPKAPDLTDWRIVGSILVISAILGTMHKVKNKGLWFGAYWILIAIIPTLPFFPYGVIFAERYLYLASIGFCFLVAYFVIKLSELELPVKNSVWMATILLVASYTAASIWRNIDWKDEVTLWQKAVAVNPTSSTMHTNLAMAYLNLGEKQMASEEIKKAISINPNNIVNQQVATNVYIQSQNYVLALEHINQLIKFNPNNFIYYIQAGDVYTNLEEWQLARDNYRKALNRDRQNPLILQRLTFVEEKLTKSKK